MIAQHLERDVSTFRMFSSDMSFDLEAMKQGMRKQLDKQGRSLLMLNFPCHNPTGYSLDLKEWTSIAEVVREAGFTNHFGDTRPFFQIQRVSSRVMTGKIEH